MQKNFLSSYLTINHSFKRFSIDKFKKTNNQTNLKMTPELIPSNKVLLTRIRAQFILIYHHNLQSDLPPQLSVKFRRQIITKIICHLFHISLLKISNLNSKAIRITVIRIQFLKN